MIDDKKILAVIPARGGSKGVRRKNIREVSGRPLLGWTIDAARKSRYIDRCVLSSDDAEIIEIARSLGCEAPFIRPAELAQDDTPGVDPVLHAIDTLPGFQFVVLLQPTSPLRSAADIDECIERCVGRNAPACVSLVEAEQSPFWMYTLGDDDALRAVADPGKPIFQRQDLPKAYVLNGAVYVAECDWLRAHKTFLTEETVGVVMPRERSLDIDSERDLKAFGDSLS